MTDYPTSDAHRRAVSNKEGRRGRTRGYYSRGMVACIPEIDRNEVYPVGEFLPPNALVELRDGALWTVDDKLTQ